MPEGLTAQERIDLGPDDGVADTLVTGSLAQVREQLLREPYFEASEVRELLGIEVVEPLIENGTLLAIKDHDDYLFPAFQFDHETNRPIETVSRVNVILDAPNDGWGVTGWWTQSNAWLPDAIAPKDLLGTPSEYAAIQLAEAVIQDDSY